MEPFTLTLRPFSSHQYKLWIMLLLSVSRISLRGFFIVVLWFICLFHIKGQPFSVSVPSYGDAMFFFFVFKGCIVVTQEHEFIFTPGL